MAKIRTTFGRYVDPPGFDRLEAMLAAHDQTALLRRRRTGLPAGPPGGALVLGLGRFGAWVCQMLARMQIPLVIVDRDVVEQHNLESGNAPYRAADIGMAKALALMNGLKAIAPQVPVAAHQADVSLLHEQNLLDLAAGAGVVLGLIDSGEAIFRINQALYTHLPVIYGAGHRRAHTGDVVISRPGDACLRCILGVDAPGDIQTLAGETTHGIDIIRLSEWCARVALVLLRDPRLGDANAVLPAGTNFIFIQNRLSPSNPGGFAPRFLRIERRLDCPVCGAS